MTQTLESQQANGQRDRKAHGRHSATREIVAGLVPATTPAGRAAEKMRLGARVAIGLGLLLFTAVVLAHLLWMWTIASRLVPDTAALTPEPFRAHWLGVSFTPTVSFTLLLIVALSAMAGSTAATAMVFSNRAGYDQLQKTWVWWYLLRPGVAAVVAVVAYVAVKSGFLGGINATQTKGLAFAVAIGGLTGLFTDKMLELLQKALGLSSFTEPATGDTAGKETSETTPAAGNADAPSPAVAGVAVGVAADVAASIPEPRMTTISLDELPEQTDNRPVPEDGEQDVDQETTPVPGSPTDNEEPVIRGVN